MLAPIVLFVYDRKEYVQKLINSLSRNDLSKESELFLFSDGPKNEHDKGKVDAVRAYLEEIKNLKIFKNVYIRYSKENKGLAKSVIGGVSEVIEQYGKVIVLEDDLIVSPHFLKFMNQSLDYYEKDTRVWSVSGFTRDIEYLRNIDKDMYFAYRAQSWSWGTWKDRWEKADWEVKDYKRFKKNFALRRAFNKGGNDMASMLDRQQCGKINSWAIRWCYTQFKNNGYTVQPQKTLVQNSGQDGSGTNCNYIREFSDLSNKQEWEFREFSEDVDINSELKKTRKHIPMWKLAGSYLVFVILKGKVPFI